MFRIYDSLSGTKKPLRQTQGITSKYKPLRLFVCGPTVYDYPHLGHARTYLVFDAFVRYLRSRGVDVFYLQNITDVDDKIIARAKELRTSPATLARKFERIYRENEKALGITSVNRYARATEHIPAIVRQVQTLLKKGHAYLIERDGYYFDLSTFPDYGKLARRTTVAAEDAVSRIDESIQKRNRGDFCLWKLSPIAELRRRGADSRRQKYAVVNGEPVWNTPLGWGRPGWHIEDTAITETFFGPQYDIHGGGVDLKFPHHEAEIAQQESASGKKPLVKIWMHAGTLRVNGEKMSKSLRNFVTITEFLKKHRPEVMRLLILSHHYRSPLNYTETLVREHERSLDDFARTLAKLRMAATSFPGRCRLPAGLRQSPASIKISAGREAIAHTAETFHEALEDDFNTPHALASLFALLRRIQPGIWYLSPSLALKLTSFFTECLGSLGIFIRSTAIPQKIIRLAARREQFRRNQQFAHSDRLRKEINALGYAVEDTPAGPFLWPAQQL